MEPTRRQFLYLTGSLAVGGTCGGIGIAEDRASESPLHSVTRHTKALGTEVSITALHANERIAAAGIENAFAELRMVESLMSIYSPDSQVSRLNRDGLLEQPHRYVVEVLQAAEAMSLRTGGAFDITVQPLWQVYANARERGALPGRDEVLAARRLIDWRNVATTPKQVVLKGSARITLNGIAQGFAADRVARALSAKGIQHALINTGELNGMGTKADGDGWVVGVQHPREGNAYVSLANLAGRCLATSGDYATPFSDDLEHHHLFDPRSGASPKQLSSVSIAARTAMEADSLSTAVFVLGIEKGMQLVKETKSADAMLITKSGSMYRSRGFPFEA